MPKRKNKNKVQSCYPCDNFDNSSVVSFQSDDSERRLTSTEAEEEAFLQSILDKVWIAIESLDAKRSETRATALRALIGYFQERFLFLDESWNHVDTFLTAVEHILKHGKLPDQVLSSDVLAVFCLQCNAFDLVAHYSKFVTILDHIVRDPSIHPAFRSSSVTALALFQSLSDYTDFVNPLHVMNLLESIFKNAAVKQDGRARVFDSQTGVLHVAALRGWTLIYTFLPPFDAQTVGKDVVPLLIALLQSSTVDLRITAGVTLAVVYECLRETNGQRFKGPYYTELVSVLEDLSTDTTKILSKNERRKQRHSFRDIYEFIMHHEGLTTSIEIGQEELILTSNVSHFRYDFLCSVLSTGMRRHLSENIHIRDLFDLGTPLLFPHGANLDGRLKRYQKKLASSLNSKTRTQCMNASRDKRNVTNDLE